jgi:hypothetical protein
MELSCPGFALLRLRLASRHFPRRLMGLRPQATKPLAQNGAHRIKADSASMFVYGWGLRRQFNASRLGLSGHHADSIYDLSAKGTPLVLRMFRLA